MDAKALLGDGDAGDEVRRLSEPLRAAVLENVPDGDVHLAMGGDMSAIVATGCCIYHLAVSRAAAPRVRRAEYAQVSGVEGRVDRGRAELNVRLADGSSFLVHAGEDRGEQAMQAATVLNLLAVEARRHQPSGMGLRATPPRRPAARRDDRRVTAGPRPRR